MKRNLLFFSALLLCLSQGYSQDPLSLKEKKSAGFLHFEFGAHYPSGSVKESIPVRQNISSYYVDQLNGGQVSSDITGWTAAVKYSYFFDQSDVAFSAGLRYTGYSGEVYGYTSPGADFFYLRYSMDDSNTRFARVKEMSESHHFISIPLEARYYPFQYQRMRWFVSAGAELGLFSFLDETDISFREDFMEEYQDEILAQLAVDSESFYSTAYIGLGVEFISQKDYTFVLEAILPSLFLSENNFSFSEVDSYSGFRFSIGFPLHKKQ